MQLPLIASSSLTTQLPIVPVTLKKPLARLVSPSDNGRTALKAAKKPCFTMSTIANTPLNVFFRFSAVSPLTLKREVSSLIFSVSVYSCSPVMGGKISRNASFTGVTTLTTPSKAFRSASIRFSRPDAIDILSANSSKETVPF